MLYITITKSFEKLDKIDSGRLSVVSELVPDFNAGVGDEIPSGPDVILFFNFLAAFMSSEILSWVKAGTRVL